MPHIGVDVGGTFTDSVAVDDTGQVYVGKAPTTPDAVSMGVMASLADLANQVTAHSGLKGLLENTRFLGHGTTVGTNALLTRNGARVGLLITAGFEDTPYIQRAIGRLAGLTEEQQRQQVSLRQPVPLVKRRHIRGVLERVDSLGEVIVPLSEEEAEAAVRDLLYQGVEAIAVCLLWSFLNPAHERLLADAVGRLAPDLPVSLSCDLTPKIRENARCNTVIIDAYVRGRVQDYLADLHGRLSDQGFAHSVATMQCFGGVTDSEHAAAISTIDSGPVGGVMASKYLAKLLDEPNVITTDVGGTSFDVSAIWRGQELIAREYFGSAGVMSRFEVLLPRVDIQSTGAGGGTIARFDAASGTIKLGPESAGADPGPVFYGRGGDVPTIADAWLTLGYLDPRRFLGGRIEVDVDAAARVIERDLAHPLGIGVPEAAMAMVELANNHMSDALKVYMTARGFDTRDFVMFAYGGGGPMHAAAYGQISGVKRTYLLANASVISAFGIGLADTKHKHEMSLFQREPFNMQALRRAFAGLEERMAAQFAREGLAADEIRARYFLDLRYRGQIHELTVEVPGRDWVGSARAADIKERFNELYAAVYGRAAGDELSDVELVGLGIEGASDAAKPALRAGDEETGKPHPLGTRLAYFAETRKFVETPVYDHAALRAGQDIEGPAFVQGDYLTMLVLPGQTARVDAFRNLVIDHDIS